jgi:predicted SnoaL-like aldol condensation-catalyzing enzyme
MAFAQGYLSPLEVNKKVVFDFYRLVFEPRNADLIDQFIAPDFIEHNPQYSGGVEGVTKLLKSLPAADDYDLGSSLRNPPKLIVAEGELVTYMFLRKVTDPKDPGKTIEKYSFDVFRVKNRKIVEHWD